MQSELDRSISYVNTSDGHGDDAVPFFASMAYAQCATAYLLRWLDADADAQHNQARHKNPEQLEYPHEEWVPRDHLEEPPLGRSWGPSYASITLSLLLKIDRNVYLHV